MNRIMNIESGRLMVVSDIHGDWDVYQWYRDQFLRLEKRGEADRLLFLGDLIHRESEPEIDRSVEIILDILRLREQFGERVASLMGNHEMPHLYRILLQKGRYIYTPRFEREMKEHREPIMNFFEQMPIYGRTPSGVSFAHAGAGGRLGKEESIRTIFQIEHRQIWDSVARSLGEENRQLLRELIDRSSRASYGALVAEQLAVFNEDDVRYDDLLIGQYIAQNVPEFELLWDALFTGNEFEHGATTYQIILQRLLTHLSRYEGEGDLPALGKQTVLVTGHIRTSGGYHELGEGKQLRIASWAHATPNEAGCYLLFDVAEKIENSEQLLKVGLHFFREE